ncbi:MULTISPECIES: hypothetical protein [Chelativorans]|jgi:hypothetical protein|uniref:Uncharacterized protein n=1 Tax=Chelativorans sp. (strain BNC1) TaxID=266779 RepID=Q11GH8_CHESB|nr:MULTISPECIES: hypothetical protein [Chelativorans]
MRSHSEDNFKIRLVERAQLLIAVQKMLAHGIPEELIPIRLAHAFYVDIDELNAVLEIVRQAKERTPAQQRSFKAA